MAAHEQIRSVPVAVVAAGSGDTQVIAAPGVGFKIRVVGYAIIASAASMNPKFKSGAGTDLTGPLGFAANGGLSVPQSHPGYNTRLSGGWFECAENAALNLNVAAIGNVGGHVAYQIVKAS